MSHKNSTLKTAGVEAVHELHIKTLRAPVSDLINANFQKKEGHRIFQWMLTHLPSGLYDALYKEMRHFEQM